MLGFDRKVLCKKYNFFERRIEMFWIIAGFVTVVLFSMLALFLLKDKHELPLGVACLLISAVILFVCAGALSRSGYKKAVGCPMPLDELSDGIYKVVAKAEGAGKTYVLLKDGSSALRWTVVPEATDPNVLATGYVQKIFFESEGMEKRTLTGLKATE